MKISKKTWLIILIIVVIFFVFETIESWPPFSTHGPKMRDNLSTTPVNNSENSSTQEDQNKDNNISKKINKEYPIEVTYPDNEDSPWAYETMYFDMNGEKLSITQGGKVNKSNGSLFFNLGNESFIERLFFYVIKDDVIAISQETDQDSGWGEVRRISTSTNKIIWNAHIPGFNLGVPVIVDNNLYISAIGFIGKLNLDTGQFIWKFENLYEDGKYNSFNEPSFNEDKVIFSTVIYRPDGQVNTIVIDDKKGQIISKD